LQLRGGQRASGRGRGEQIADVDLQRLGNLVERREAHPLLAGQELADHPLTESRLAGEARLVPPLPGREQPAVSCQPRARGVAHRASTYTTKSACNWTCHVIMYSNITSH